MKQLTLIIWLLSALVGNSQSREDSLLLLVKLYGVAEFVVEERGVSEATIEQTIAYCKEGIPPQYDHIVDQLFPEEPKQNYKLIDTANLLVVNDPTFLLTNSILSESSKAKLRYAILGKRKSLKMVKKEFHFYPYRHEIDSLDSFYMLEGFFRFWNGIAYGYPHINTLNQPWDETFLRYLPQFIPDQLKSKRDYLFAIHGLSVQINDGHLDMDYYKSNKQYRQEAREHEKLHKKAAKEEKREGESIKNDTVRYSVFPIHLELINNELYVKNTLPKYIKDLEVGEVVEKIDGISPDVYNDSIFRQIAISRPEMLGVERNKRMQWLYGHKKDTLILQIKGRKESIALTKVKVKPEEYSSLIAYDQWEKTPEPQKEYAYVQVWTENRKLFKKEIKRSIKENIPLIIDARNYPDKLFVATIAKYFSNKPKDISDFYLPLKHYPGYYGKIDNMPYFFTNFPDLALKMSFILPFNANVFYPITKKVDNKVVLLIDEHTVSYGETIALIIKEYAKDGVVIGRNTQGANGNIGSVVLPGNVEVSFTHYRIDAQGGISYQHTGVPPDIYVKEPIPSKDNPDPIMTTALNYLFNDSAVVK